MSVVTTLTPADTATATPPAARATVKVRTVSRLVAVTASPWKPPWVATPLVRTPVSESSCTDWEPLPVRFIGPTVGVLTWPSPCRLDRSPLTAAVLVEALPLSMPCIAFRE